VDRREALKKLGAAGAVVAGGSAVLSSRSVAQAASACVVTPPTSVPLRFTQPNGSPRLIRVRWQNNRPAGTSSQTYSWRNAQILFPTSGGVQIQGSTSRETSLQRITSAPRARDRVWVAGDRFQVQVQVTWTCTGRRGPDVITYQISETARARGSQWTANATRV
jgi:hypothetical protein